MSDIESRMDDLDAREAAGGGPTAIVEALVQGQRRQGRFILITAFSVLFDISLSVVLFLVVLASNGTAHASEKNTNAIATLVSSQALVNWNTCQRSVTNTTKLNANAAAIASVLTSAKPTPELTALLATFQADVLTIPDCGPKP